MTEAVFLDIDGVLTDGRIYMDGNGAALKTLNLKDLDAITSMRGEGIRVGCVSGEDTPFSQAIRHYVDFAALGCKDKPAFISRYCRENGLDLQNILYVGDGKYDIGALKMAGISACPADAIPAVREVCRWVLETKGGCGCVASVYDRIQQMNRNKQKDRQEDRKMGRVFVIAEIGINHNGDMEICKKLIEWAVLTGCDAVKFQKRTIDKVYTKEYLDSYRESPWGTTQREQKEGLEFGKEEYDEIDRFCRERGIEWLASAWDVDAQRFLRQYDLKYNKVASAMLTNMELLQTIAEEKKYTYISTGMSTYEEIDAAVEVFKKNGCPYELMHCNSTYPMKNEDANLRVMNALRERYGVNVGYSGHETGRIVSLAAVALGATSLERHITLGHSMYGSDQAASLEVDDLQRLVKDIRVLEIALGSGEKVLTPAEEEVRKKLRNA